MSDTFTDTLNANSEENAEQIIEDTEKSLYDLAEKGTFSQSYLKFNKALDETIKMATLAMQNDQVLLAFNWANGLREKLGGLHKSDLIILAGRPSMGKPISDVISFNASQNF